MKTSLILGCLWIKNADDSTEIRYCAYLWHFYSSISCYRILPFLIYTRPGDVSVTCRQIPSGWMTMKRGSDLNSSRGRDGRKYESEWSPYRPLTAERCHLQFWVKMTFWCFLVRIVHFLLLTKLQNWILSTLYVIHEFIKVPFDNSTHFECKKVTFA